MLRVRLAWVTVTCVLTLAPFGCRRPPKPGSACKEENEAQCLDTSRIVTCRRGRWEEIACKGPRGCSTAGAVVH